MMMRMMNDMSVYISPPFGNYIGYKRCNRIRGTYTWERRSGLIRQTLKTLRPVEGGWINKIGFRNPGVVNIKDDCDRDSIYSIAAIDSDWSPFIEKAPQMSRIELNIGCPNVGNYSITDEEIKRCVDRFIYLQVKLSPTVELDYISKLYDLGVKIFHLSNTVPTENGGISGKQLKEVNLPLVEKVVNMNLQGSAIIAGGGIYTPQDVRDYRNAGVTSYSLSTIWFTPWKVPAVYEEIMKC